MQNKPPEKGSMYQGRIIAVDPNLLHYVVTCDEFTEPFMECLWVGGFFSKALGLRSSYIPSIGSAVTIVYGNPSLILSTSATGTHDPDSGRTRNVLGAPSIINNGEVDEDSGEKETRGSIPRDIIEGELDLTNIFGVGISLLTYVAKLSAGGRAAFETLLLNETARILSENFQHFSSFGEHEIYNDGGCLTCEWHGTAYEHEAYGLENKDDEKGDVKQNAVNYDEEDLETARGRHRFSEYVGYVGDFIHKFVTDPVEMLGSGARSNMKDTAYRSGKFHEHVNSDGTYILQSVGDIVFERVVRIPVPMRKKRYDDPEGNTDREIANFPYDKKFFDTIPPIAEDKKAYEESLADMATTSYHLRSYARWLSQYYSYYRFHQLDKDFDDALSEEVTPPPDYAADTPGSTPMGYVDTYSTIRIMRDGSQVFLDGYGDSIVMSQGRVHVSARKDMFFESAGDMNFIAGQSINMKARRNVSIVAVVGGLTLKARAWWRALSEVGTMWFKSDAKDPNSGDPPAPESGDPIPDVHPQAIVLQAENGGITYKSNTQQILVVEGSDNASDMGNSFTVKAKNGKFNVYANKDIDLRSDDKFIALGREGAYIKSFKDILLSFTQTCLVGLTEFRQRGFEVYAPSLVAKQVSGGSFQAKSGYATETKMALVGTEKEFDANLDQTKIDDPVELTPEILQFDVYPNGGRLPQWEYSEGGDSYHFENFHQSYAQQMISNEPAIAADYGEWEWKDDKPSDTTTNKSETPWPGQRGRWKTLDNIDEDPLYTPTAKTCKDHKDVRKKQPKQEQVKFKYYKYDE